MVYDILSEPCLTAPFSLLSPRAQAHHALERRLSGEGGSGWRPPLRGDPEAAGGAEAEDLGLERDPAAAEQEAAFADMPLDELEEARRVVLPCCAALAFCRLSSAECVCGGWWVRAVSTLLSSVFANASLIALAAFPSSLRSCATRSPAFQASVSC